jgi:RIO kinase 1
VKIPASLHELMDEGVIDEVLNQLQSGKEATVYVIRSGGERRCAKVYKSVEKRNFKSASMYQEGRRLRGSRDSRAAGRRSRHGRKVQEIAWKSAEADALSTLAQAQVRVPRSFGLFDGVLIMELICDAQGYPAPRLSEVELDPAMAQEWHDFMLRQIVRMLCAGLVHGDLSEYNVLVDATGPVIIDLPQAVQVSGNNNAFALLARDVINMRSVFSRVIPELAHTRYAEEIWKLYTQGELHPDSPLTGHFQEEQHDTDIQAVLDEIEDAQLEHEARERGRREAEAEERED